MLQIKLFIFYSSFLVFPFLIFLFYKIKNWKNFKKYQKIFFSIFFLLSLVFIDARFIEPNYLLVKKTEINIWLEEEIKIALISDIHLWIYKKWKFAKKIVKKLNSLENIDYILIAWDLTYLEENKENYDLEKLFWAFKNIKKPVYWVLWNHDVELPWPKIREKLVKEFNKYNFKFLNNKIIELEEFNLIWLWSNWSWEDKIEIISKIKNSKKNIVLTHNPDTTIKYKNNLADLTLCWHTHWWQIKIPYLYKLFLPVRWIFDEWLTQEKNTQLFITSGLWIIGLPFRFFNPPVIDILEIN
jgi:predicted MPP superfamily phosphohydrolase